jgi:hypothetical protein
MITKNIKIKFYIKIFPDYHDICDTKEFKSLELGCFPTKNGWCRNYYGLFYKGGKPKFKDIKKTLFENIDFSKEIKHGITGKDISITEKMVEDEVRESLKNI